MEPGLESLSAQQQESLALFCEVTANARDRSSAVRLLESVKWDVEQALQLHWAAGEDEARAPRAAEGLEAPLLARGQEPTGPPAPARYPLVGWIARVIRGLGVSVLGALWAFFFGAGQRLGGPASGQAFSRALVASYGAQLQLPDFFAGSFPQALQAARRDLKLLVVYLHSENARYSQRFCNEVLGSEFIRSILNESFLLWGGDVSRMETHYVAQMIHVRQYPCFCVLLPASVDEIRVIGALHGDVQVDAAVGLLTNCLEEMESHRSEIAARREQQAEDRSLREQQDREYQEALEVDKRREEQQQLLEREQREVQRQEEERQRQERELLERQEAQRLATVERRRALAEALEIEAPESKARVSLRLPAGQRVQRRFRHDAPLADIYKWADCCAYLPENKDRGLEVPNQFMLKTSFPSKELTEMNSSIEELQLAGTNILLAAIEDDD